MASLVLGLIHTNLQISWLLDRISQVNNKVLIDVVAIRRFRLVDAPSFVLCIFHPTSVVSSRCVLNKLLFPVCLRSSF